MNAASTPIRTVVPGDRACARRLPQADAAGPTLAVAPPQSVDVHRPPYEPGFESHVRRREKGHVQEP